MRPADMKVLTKPTNLISTVRFLYANQYSTTVRTKAHGIGRANLFIAWAVDADEDQKGAGLQYNPQGTVHSLPHARYVFYDNDPDPKVEDFISIPYDNYIIYNYKTYYYIVYDALAGPPGQTYQDYVRMTIFNDTFDAPFIVPEVS